jgi:hypothetical protein
MDGSTELKGSNETVTKCRFATAKVTKIRPSRMMNRVLKNLRMTIARIDPAASCGKGARESRRPQA